MPFINFTQNYYGNVVKNTILNLGVDYYYTFVADGISETAVANNDPKTIYDEQTVIHQIMYGKRVQPVDAIVMIRRIPWVSGKVFNMYESRDPNLDEKDFYVITTNRRVYKCLNNNNGSPSTMEPSFVDYLPTTLGDGYTWKLLYSLTENQLNDYGTTKLIPIFTDNVPSPIIPGSISSIVVEDGGFYPNSTNANILQISNPTRFRISDAASATSQIYNGSSMYITSGAAQGKIARIVNYTVSPSGKFVDVDSAITGLTIGDSFNIAPSVVINGDGINALARAIVVGDMVTNIQMINVGRDYTHATATLVSNPIFDTPGSVEVNVSPIDGHGSDLPSELYANYALLSIELDHILNEDIPQNDLTFAKTGLLRNLKTEANTEVAYTGDDFSNLVSFDVDYVLGTFVKGDTIKNNETIPAEAKVVFVDTSGTDPRVFAVYQSKQRFSNFQTLTNQNGVNGQATNLIQPDVRVETSSILSISNLDTLSRNENSREIIQFLIKVK